MTQVVTFSRYINRGGDSFLVVDTDDTTYNLRLSLVTKMELVKLIVGGPVPNVVLGVVREEKKR